MPTRDGCSKCRSDRRRSLVVAALYAVVGIAAATVGLSAVRSDWWKPDAGELWLSECSARFERREACLERAVAPARGKREASLEVLGFIGAVLMALSVRRIARLPRVRMRPLNEATPYRATFACTVHERANGIVERSG